jgi:transcriptional regulator with XRE-family HTH domain
MTQALANSPVNLADGRLLHGANVKRLMVRLNMTLSEVVEATGLDERTVRSILRGTTRPHARTLHKLATGLGVDPDELFHDPRDAMSAFDRAANPAVAEVIESHPHLFAQWTPADFEELFSRVAVGGELTEHGAVTAARTMNSRRELMKHVALILESSEADLLCEFVAILYRRITESLGSSVEGREPK